MTKTKSFPKPDTHKTSKASTSLMKDKSPHLSSTMVSGVERLRDKMSVPEGISPILKSKHKSKAASKENNVSSNFDEVMANSKIGSQNSEITQATMESGKSDKSSNVKDGRSIENDKKGKKKKY